MPGRGALLRGLAIIACAGLVGGSLAFGCNGEETEEEPSCEGLLTTTNDCFRCITAQCCPALADCLRDTEVGGCTDCLAGDKSACHEGWTALYECGLQACTAQCTGPIGEFPSCDAPETPPSAGACVSGSATTACNPLTLEGCGATETCEPAGGAFRCFEGGNQTLCQPCGEEEGWCQPGLACHAALEFAADGVTVTNRCARPCCDDGDCGSGACALKLAVETGEAGVCLGGNTTPGSGGEAGQGGGAGGEGGGT